MGIPVLGRKGAAVHVRELVAALVRAGHSVVVAAPVTTKSPWEEPAELRCSLLQVEPAPELTSVVEALKATTRSLDVSGTLPGELRRIVYDGQLVGELRRRFCADPPDLVYERASLHSIAGAKLAEALAVPRIVEVNAPLALEQAAYRGSELVALAGAAERRTLTSADVVAAVSSALRDYALSLGCDASRVHVVPNGVDTRLFHPGPRDEPLAARLGLNGGPVLGYVSGLRPWHGIEILPPLVERLRGRYPDVRLVVVGDGPGRGELERDFRERRLCGNVTFTGSLPHEEVAPLIRLFDAGLVPYSESRDHAFYYSPLKLFEYMACAVPVVGARVGQISEVLSDGETGLLYPPGELDALTATCERLLVEPLLRARLGRAASEHVRSRYTWDANAAHISTLARQLGASRNGHG